MMREGNVARRNSRIVHKRCWGEEAKERDHLKDLGAEEEIILKLLFNRRDGMACTGIIWLRIGTVGGLL